MAIAAELAKLMTICFFGFAIGYGILVYKAHWVELALTVLPLFVGLILYLILNAVIQGLIPRGRLAPGTLAAHVALFGLLLWSVTVAINGSVPSEDFVGRYRRLDLLWFSWWTIGGASLVSLAVLMLAFKTKRS